MSPGSSLRIAAVSIALVHSDPGAQRSGLQRHAPAPVPVESTELGRLVAVGMATAGSEGLLELALVGLPVVGSPFQLEVRNATPGTSGFLVIGLGEDPVAVPTLGAVLHPAEPWQYQPFFVDAEGVSSPLFASVPSAATHGASFYVQALALDALATGGLAVTKAAELRFGSDRGWTILPVPTIRLGGTPTDGELVDLDHDEKLDLVTVKSSISNDALMIWLGTSELDEPFELAAAYALGTSPQELAVADFDGDGNADLAVSQDSPEQVSILLGNGDGTFVSTTSFPADSPRGMTAADVDGDGDLDLAVLEYWIDSVELFLGNGAGTFVSAGTSSVGDAPRDVVLEDLDLDGAPELIVGLFEGLDVLAGHGDGTFGPAVLHPAPNAAVLARGDFNEDGLTDVVSNRSIFLGTGTGLAPAQSLPWNLHFPLARDMDRDGHLDLAGYGVIFLGAGDGTFGGSLSYNVSSANFEGLVAGDLDGDGRIEIGVGESGAWKLHHGLEDGSVASIDRYSMWSSPNGNISVMAIGDVDGDQVADVVAGKDNSLELSLAKGNGDGTLQAPVILAVGPHTSTVESVNSVQIVDLDGDGFQDILVAVHGGALQPRALVAYGQGAGVFGVFHDLPTNATTEAVAAADLDGDGIRDLVVASLYSDAIQVRRGVGNRNFGPQAAYPSGASPVGLFVGDLDGNDLPEIVAANEDSDTITVYFNQGGAVFGGRLDLAVGNRPGSIGGGDVDGNGTIDLLVENDELSSIVLLSNLGGGSFAAPVSLPVSGAEELRVADLTSDGKLDVVVATGSGLEVLTNRGDGTFVHRTYDSAAAAILSVEVGDLNRDLIPDVLAGGYQAKLFVHPQRFLDPDR